MLPSCCVVKRDHSEQSSSSYSLSGYCSQANRHRYVEQMGVVCIGMIYSIFAPGLL